MFCRNCGSKLPDDAKFCVSCGAKVESTSATNRTTNYVENMSFAGRPEPQRKAQPEKKVSFDWSEVVEESHKRKIPNVQSPWGSTGLDEESAMKTQKVVTERPHVRYSDDDLMENLNQPSTDPSRTMSFIDILKAEREEKERNSARMAQEHTEKQYATPDYSAFDHADGFSFENDILPANDREITQGYTDMNLDIVKEMQSAKPSKAYEPEQPVHHEYAQPVQPAYHEPVQPAQPTYHEYAQPAQPAYHEPVQPVQPAQPVQPEPKRYATPVEPVESSSYEPEDEYLNDYLFEQPAEEQPAHSRPSFEDAFTAEPDEEDTFEPISTPAVDYTDDYTSDYTNGSTEDFYLDNEEIEQPQAEESGMSLEDELAAILGAQVQPTAEPAPVAEPTPVVEPTPAPTAEPEVVAEPEDAKESEIEALKRRLAELMGDSAEEPQVVAKHETPDLAELVEDDTDFEDEEPEAPAELSLEDLFADDDLTTAPEVAHETAPEAVVAPEEPEESAGLSLEDLFGDDEKESAPEAEAETAHDVAPEVVAGAVTAGAVAVGTAVAGETVNAGEVPAVPEADIEPESDAMSIDDLERDLFGDDFAEDAEAEATKKIDKFYTLYKKNEEFQKLLDEEYNKLQGEEPSAEMDQQSEIDALFAQQQPVAQMSMPSASENSFVDSQPVQQQPVQMPSAVQPVAQQEEPVQQIKAEPVADLSFIEDDEDDENLSKKDRKAKKKAEKKAKKAKKAAALDDDDEEESGSALTIIAVVISVLLLLLLGIILILNFAPESGIGLKIDTIIQTITSYFSVLDGVNDEFLL